MVYFVSGIGIFSFPPVQTVLRAHPYFCSVFGRRCFIRDEAVKKQKLITLSCGMKLYRHTFVSHLGVLLDWQCGQLWLLLLFTFLFICVFKSHSLADLLHDLLFIWNHVTCSCIYMYINAVANTIMF